MQCGMHNSNHKSFFLLTSIFVRLGHHSQRTQQVKIWRRHLHKFDDMDVPTAQAAAAALEQRVAAVRSERKQAAAAQRKVCGVLTCMCAHPADPADPAGASATWPAARAMC
jgi:hypothetical protein